MAEPQKPGTEMSGGQAAPGGNPPAAHDQPNDAVPMSDLAQSTPLSDADKVQPQAEAEPSSSSKHGDPENADKGKGTAEDTIEPSPAKDKGVDTTGQTQTSASASASSSAPQPPAKATRSDSMAIGPSVDHVQPVTPGQPSDGLVCNITLLLTTGARHPYRIDERYLTKRNVNVPGTTEDGRTDPFSISIYTLKELILREWRDEWDPKPASPSSIRLIHFGKLLDDKEPLRQYHFSADTANVVHMTVRPADLIEEEEPKGGSKSASGTGRGRAGGHGCCVIL